MIGYGLVFLAGATISPLFLRINKKYAAWFFRTADWIEVKIEEKTGKDI
tara:strand:- start:315 stop:461 length:147 start_codon:yes stop_codon:yes gene_type:complete